MDVRVVVGQQVEVGQPVEQAADRDAGLQPGQVQAQAGVLTGGEGDVRGGLAEDVELLGTLPALLIAIRRTDAHPDHGARRNRNPFQLN